MRDEVLSAISLQSYEEFLAVRFNHQKKIMLLTLDMKLPWLTLSEYATRKMGFIDQNLTKRLKVMVCLSFIFAKIQKKASQLYWGQIEQWDTSSEYSVIHFMFPCTQYGTTQQRTLLSEKDVIAFSGDLPWIFNSLAHIIFKYSFTSH